MFTSFLRVIPFTYAPSFCHHSPSRDRQPRRQGQPVQGAALLTAAATSGIQRLMFHPQRWLGSETEILPVPGR